MGFENLHLQREIEEAAGQEQHSSRDLRISAKEPLPSLLFRIRFRGMQPRTSLDKPAAWQAAFRPILVGGWRSTAAIDDIARWPKSVSEGLCQVWQNDTPRVSTLVMTLPEPLQRDTFNRHRRLEIRI